MNKLYLPPTKYFAKITHLFLQCSRYDHRSPRTVCGGAATRACVLLNRDQAPVLICMCELVIMHMVVVMFCICGAGRFVDIYVI